MKLCSKCKQSKLETEFYKDKSKKTGLNYICISCSKEKYKIYKSNNKQKINLQQLNWYYKNKEKINTKNKILQNSDPRSRMMWLAKHRAKKYNLCFNIEKTDIIIPEYCPILKLKLLPSFEKSKDNSPTLDRINCNKGYIKGNIQVISRKANIMKSNANKKELLLFADWILKYYE